ncbi:hypothetical protein FSP39_016200 [Pinctada imbricata]|uniref:Uncharacterized protein n=1 Tax=Pinctada imbricata TaxID=66713 RepID=A0AA89BS51_PINIB|nr:hypothetical protein FSP39_016200 [Pinctada imbricata]
MRQATYLFLNSAVYAEAGLEHEEKQLSGNEWMARLVVHVLSRLYIGEKYRLDSHYRNRLPRCPCPCKINLKYGSTHIGNPRTYYGCLDVIMGVDGAVAVCETKVNDEDDIDEDEIIAEPSDEDVKVTPLSQNLPQLHSQTIVFSFYQNNCNNDLTFVPIIGICKSHIQFHFYDSTRDIYLMSCEIPLFEDNIPWKLNLSAVVAIWLVVNYKQLMGSCPNEIEKLEKFGFHNFCGEHLQYYKDIKLGPFKTEPVQFQDFLQGTGNYRKLNVGACEAVERKYTDI